MQDSNDTRPLPPPALENSEITPTQWQNIDPSTLLANESKLDRPEWQKELFGFWELPSSVEKTPSNTVLIASTPNGSPNIFIDMAGKQQDETVYTRVCISDELPPLPAIEDFKRHFLVVNDALNVLFDIAKNHFEALLNFEKKMTCYQHQLDWDFLTHEKERELFAISLKFANDAGITYLLLVEGLTTYRLLFKIVTRTTTYY